MKFEMIILHEKKTQRALIFYPLKTSCQCSIIIPLRMSRKTRRKKKEKKKQRHHQKIWFATEEEGEKTKETWTETTTKWNNRAILHIFYYMKTRQTCFFFSFKEKFFSNFLKITVSFKSLKKVKYSCFPIYSSYTVRPFFLSRDYDYYYHKR